MLGIDTLVKKIFGTKSAKDLKSIQPLVDKINAVYPSFANISHDELRNKTLEFKNRIQQNIQSELKKIEELTVKTNDLLVDINQKENLYREIDDLEQSIRKKTEDFLLEILPEAFAVIRETARRLKNGSIEVTANEYDKEIATKKDCVEIVQDKAIWKNTWTAAGTQVTWDMVHYDVQLIGGIVLHSGKIAEMATGEGKTLVATLPIYLNALPGKGVHVVTVNDYLAKRDSEWMGPIFEFHGLRIDCIDKHQPNSPGRKNAYLADITYGTNNEFGFDYLRDNMASGIQDLVQRKHNYAIVDEVDSVLIDDARTPLIISGPTPKGDTHEFNEFKPKVEKLVRTQKEYVNLQLIDAKKLLTLKPEDFSDKKEYEKKQKEGSLALLRAYRGLPKNKALIKFLSEPGIRTILQKTENFHMQDNNKEMHKADAELYFVIDEKSNSIDLTEKGLDLISGNTEDSNFFVVPDVGSRMADIEKRINNSQEKLQAKDDLMREYSQKIERIHTIQQLLKAYTLFERDVEYVIMDGKVKIVDEQTGRIMEGRRYSDGLHQAIEAKENVKVENATQTYATITLQNYFRMYHKLAGMTGTAITEATELWEIYKLDVVEIPTNKSIQRKDMEDLVYKTDREKYNAIIQEIEKLVEAKRPVLVGTTSVETSEKLSRMLKMRNIKHNVLNAKLHQKEAEIVANAGYPGTVTIATNMAGRGTDIKLKEGVKEAGGLAIIGTERHESRRVDRQLRGRAGRQGDPGSSQFFVSLEDNLMRLFGSERIAALMDRMGHKEGDVIQHSMITKSIERAQKKVEENNFGIRKRLLEYDDVMNSQREVIYKKRRHALYEDRLSIDIYDAMYDTVDALVKEYSDSRDYENFSLEVLRLFGIDVPLSEEEFLKISNKDLSEKLFTLVITRYNQRKQEIAEKAFPVIKNVFEGQGSGYQNIVIPFTDGVKSLDVLANMKKCYETQGKYVPVALEKSVTLALIDEVWKEHLRELDDLKQNIQGGASYEQKDPLITYKIESFNLFKKMLEKVNQDIVSFLCRAGLPNANPQSLKEGEQQRSNYQNVKVSRSAVPEYASDQEQARNQQQGQKVKQQPVVVEEKIGRNDPCPCGSGKKYKQCHGSEE